MVSRLKVLTLVSCIGLLGAASSAEACCWLFGGGCGGWGAFRPLTWGGYYGGGWSNCGNCGACGYGGCGSCGYGASGYGACGGCSGGACGGQSFYGPVCDHCCGTGCSSCSSFCGTPTYAGTADCCTQYSGSSEPTPDSKASQPGPDSFRGTNPDNSGRSSIPPDANWNRDTGEYGSGRGVDDNSSDYLNGGGDAPDWSLPRNPNPTEPSTEPDLRNTEPIRVEPLDVNTPVAVSYQPTRERVRLWSTYRTPKVATKDLPDVNAGWEPVASEQHVASR